MNDYFRKLADVTEEALNQFVQARIPEGKTIEYKQQLDFSNQRHTDTFLKEVVAFANTSGGDIFLGIDALDGVPVSAPGLLSFNTDAETIRLQNIIRTRIQPRLFGVGLHAVPLSNGATVLMVRVPRATGPFMFENKFYIRSGPEARPMDFVEVSQAFDESEMTANRLRNFRIERCARILNGEGPIEMNDEHFTVLHVVPLDALSHPNRFSIATLLGYRSSLWPLGAEGCSPGIDLDGVYQYTQNREDKHASAYSLLMRSGIVESLEACWLSPRNGDDGQVFRYFPYGAMEPGIADHVAGVLKVLEKMEVGFPVAVFISLLNVRGHTFLTSGHVSPWNAPKPLRLDTLYLPEVVVRILRLTYTRRLSQPLTQYGMLAVLPVRATTTVMVNGILKTGSAEDERMSHPEIMNPDSRR